MTQISLKSLMTNNAAPYSPEFVQPFREELIMAGFKELLTPVDVDAALNRQDNAIVLVVLNSVCGCAAGSARPGTMLSMLNALVPDEYVTLFAGMEKQAVVHFRENYLPGCTPSSPNIALFKNGRLLHILHRHNIEGKTAGEIAKELAVIYDTICNKKKLPEETGMLKDYIESRYHVSIESLIT